MPPVRTVVLSDPSAFLVGPREGVVAPVMGVVRLASGRPARGTE